MPKILNINSYSLNIKVTFSLLLLSIFLLSILFLLIVPKMHKEQLQYTKDQIDKIIQLSTEQVKVAAEAISIQADLEKSETKYKIELELTKLRKEVSSFIEIKKYLKDSFLLKHCSYFIKTNNYTDTNIEKNINIEKIKDLNFNTWQMHEFDFTHRTLNRKSRYFSYKTVLNFDNSELTLMCSDSNLNKNHSLFEKGIKSYVQKGFSLTQEFHHGKSYLIWINPDYANDNSKPLYEKDEKKRREKYSISNMSNVNNIYTGDLTAKQIMDNVNKEPIIHMLNGKKAISWIKDLRRESSPKNYIFLLISTIYLDDLHNHIDSSFWKILPAALTALIFAFVAGFFLLKRLFKGINILSNTAKQINNGNKEIRSNVKGNDDIGNLGIAFDSMLDLLQNNIKTLDKKVEEKTNKLQSSLEEKELLLKEIHHRVKNNLALTIGLIKLQQTKIKDENTKKVLEDIQKRIYTMELLHRKLYESSNLDNINFKNYIINLVHDIEKSYDLKQNIEIKIKVDEIYLNIEKALPCGLILNELITNSFKYAFKDNTKPKLLIKMKKIENSYVLIVQDNGKGLEKDIDIYNSKTLGLKLINSISSLQLGGELKYKYKNGSNFKIKFK